ncbi:MAG TPA: ABC transporter substrate-binding protein [Paludibacter sp.]|nr:ABC transporter substrate-binding protein [Paludibacter sp.]
MKNIFSKLLIIVLAGILFVSCTNKSPEAIRIGILNGPSAVSFIKLIDQPHVIHGKKIEIIIKSEPQQIQALMMQGKLDFAILPTIMAANLYNKGVHYRMVACPIWGTLYLLTNTTTKKITGIKNQTISLFGQGSTADVLLQRLIKESRVSNVRIDYTLSTNSDIAQALKLRKIKFAVVSEPLVSKLLTQDSTLHILTKLTCEEFLLNTFKNVFVQTSFLVSNRFTVDNPTLVALVCKTYTESCNFVNKQPEEAAKLLIKHKMSSDLAIAKQSIPLCNINYVSSFAVAQEIDSYLRIFYKFNSKSIGGKIPDKDFIYQIY